ncbi:MAG: dual specificity protein phosphatase family protein [Ignavibacteriales bacterium]
MPERFSWIISGRLAGMERPGLLWRLEEDLDFLKSTGISVIVNLEEYVWNYDGFRVKHIPIRDFKAPRLADIEEFVRFIDGEIWEERQVVVHCYAGMGRTNLMLAAYLIHLGMELDNALNLIKEKRPYHAVNEEQEEALSEYFYVIKKTT